ncbi:hypothetical protein [Acidisoma sp. 7E03]
MSEAASEALRDLVAAELARPAPAGLERLVDEVLAAHGAAVRAVLFYGSCRRTGDLSGLVDLYVLYDTARDFHGGAIAALANRLLPPNVSLLRADGLRAKVATLSLRQFQRRVRRDAIDTTIWTRFAQPCSLIYVRDETARRAVTTLAAEAARTALFWARHFTPDATTPAALWQGLFAQTYRTELRPESSRQPAHLYETNAAWFDALAAASPAEAATLPRGGWALRRICGRPLNLARLAKAAFTFTGGADYILWKVQRHAGIRLSLSDWQRRHPLLAAPGVLWRLRRAGALR